MQRYNYLVDSHCHLKYMRESGLFADCVVEDALENGVKILNNICADISEIEDVLRTTEKYDCVFCVLGQHPENAGRAIAGVDFLVEKSKHEKVIGLGETGLDYHFDDSPGNKILQKKNFEAHIEACRRTKLPLVIHSRDCDGDMADILRQEMKNGEFRFVFHCFSSGKDLAHVGLDLGGFISFSGILTFKNSAELQALAKNIPLDRILVETDAPFLAPVPYRGKINRPSYVKKTAEFLGLLLGESFENIQNLTTGNFFNLFPLARAAE